MKNKPVTVVTGELGSGKTTVILNMLRQFPSSYKVVWLKNEYGDVNIDTQLSNSSNIQTKEILNGCLCCVLIGKLKNGIKELLESTDFDRLIIETAGTAYPYPIIKEITEVEGIHLDGLIKVIDLLNYKDQDKSFLAKQQSKFIDILVLNKHELCSKDQLYMAEEDIYDVYSTLPKTKSDKGFVKLDLLCGYENLPTISEDFKNNHEDHFEGLNFKLDHTKLTKELLLELAKKLPKKVYRVKGLFEFDDQIYILNGVNSRFNLDLINQKNIKKDNLNIVILIGEHILELEAQIKEIFKTVL